ncbi:MAG: acyltransferase [Betaproteobacteria bacterium]|nr:acyltransferase [Betaproteobacteria bacterium]
MTVQVQSKDSKALAYRPDIDGLRALAVLFVLLFHAFPSLLPGGFVGVDVFFVISGYLITGLILRDLESGQFSLRHFMRGACGASFRRCVW